MRTRYHASITHPLVPINKRMVWKGDKWEEFIACLKRTCADFYEEFGVSEKAIDVVIFDQIDRKRYAGKAHKFINKEAADEEGAEFLRQWAGVQ